jgi:hypothetical protein
MTTSFKLKALVAALALGAAGSAFANTSLSPTGTIVADVNDGVTGDSFVFDTGLTTSSFNGNGSYSFNLSSDANYQAFLSAVGANASGMQYDVIGVSKAGANAAIGDKVLTTASGIGASILNSKVAGALAVGGTYYSSVNAWSSPTLTSAFVNTSGDAASFGPFDANWQAQLALNDVATVGTAMSFYSATMNNTRSGNATLATFAGTWNLVGNTLTYAAEVGPAVPVPASWGLLLSGLALMGVIARRGKSSDGDFISGAAA